MGRTHAGPRTETLPYSWYADPAVAAAERDRIFRRSWLGVVLRTFVSADQCSQVVGICCVFRYTYLPP